jgi:polar amino acid transport system ATP-binding protein/putative ABC transport system ATP-binding protein
MIEFRNISLSFQGKSIFENFNAKIPAGAKISVGGASGRGKSSLLKLIQGYLIPDSGKMIVDSEEITSKSIHQLRKKMAWIPQNINLPVNNGAELVELMEVAKHKESIEQYLKMLDLEGAILDQDFFTISGGQKQRIVISIVLSLGKPIVLMDEPTSSLDERAIANLLELVNTLKNTTFVSASHNKTWLDHSDKVIEL